VCALKRLRELLLESVANHISEFVLPDNSLRDSEREKVTLHHLYGSLSDVQVK